MAAWPSGLELTSRAAGSDWVRDRMNLRVAIRFLCTFSLLTLAWQRFLRYPISSLTNVSDV